MTCLEKNCLFVTLQKDLNYKSSIILDNFQIQGKKSFSVISNISCIIRCSFAPSNYYIQSNGDEQNDGIISCNEHEGIYYKINNVGLKNGYVELVSHVNQNNPVSILFTFYESEPQLLPIINKDKFFGTISSDSIFNNKPENFTCNPPIINNGKCMLFSTRSALYQCSFINPINYIHPGDDNWTPNRLIMSNADYLQVSYCDRYIQDFSIKLWGYTADNNIPYSQDSGDSLYPIDFFILFL